MSEALQQQGETDQMNMITEPFVNALPLAACLASDDAACDTGVNVSINGGLRME